MNFYELLEVSKEANALEIKRAYYKKVKQQPPEKYPEEFKAYRKAYEVLSNVEQKQEYDKGLQIPAEFQSIYKHWEVLAKNQEVEKIIQLLKPLIKEINFPEFLTLRLGEAYLINENWNNAIKIFEELDANLPNSVDLEVGLANAYEKRGYHKKAQTQIEKVLEKYPGSAEAWEVQSRIFVRKNDMEQAFESLKKSAFFTVGSSQKSLTIQLKLFEFSFEQGNYKEAWESVEAGKLIVSEHLFLMDRFIGEIINFMSANFIEQGHPRGMKLLSAQKILKSLYSIDPTHSNLIEFKDVIERMVVSEKKGHIPLSNSVSVRQTPKVGRNDPCPYGSGKKFKKCCS